MFKGIEDPMAEKSRSLCQLLFETSQGIRFWVVQYDGGDSGGALCSQAEEQMLKESCRALYAQE